MSPSTAVRLGVAISSVAIVAAGLAAVLASPVTPTPLPPVPAPAITTSAPPDATPPPPDAPPEPEPEPEPTQRNVRAGAFCAPSGAHGITSSGVRMVCTTTATDDRNRWRRA